jgi:hypothetical protein
MQTLSICGFGFYVMLIPVKPSRQNESTIKRTGCNRIPPINQPVSRYTEMTEQDGNIAAFTNFNSRARVAYHLMKPDRRLLMALKSFIAAKLLTSSYQRSFYAARDRKGTESGGRFN